jgi:hypothetical protein
VHLLAVGAVAGGVLLVVPGRIGHAWWILAGASGALLLAAELARHPHLWRELCGGATLLKLLLVAAVAAAPAAGPWLVAAAIVVAGLGAHLPRDWRHRRLF